MSRIDDLLRELCPDGVEFRSLGEITVNFDSQRRPVTRASRVSGPYPYYGANGVQDHVAEYIFDGTYLLMGEDGSVTRPNGRPVLNWAVGKIWVSNHAHVLQSASSDLSLRFLYFYLATVDISHLVTGGTQPKLNQWNMKRIAVPVPPLEVQDEIVKILDTFSALTAELEAELEARRTQYEYYRDVVLEETRTEGTSVPISDLGHVVTGRTPKSSEAAFWGSEVDFITPSDIKNGAREIAAPARRLSGQGSKKLAKALLPARSILVTCIGTVGKTIINANECVTNQQINALIPDASKVLSDYLFHALTAMREQIRKQSERSEGTMPIINKTDFSRIQVWVPALETQERISKQLNSFDALVNDLSSGLPAEIEARRKQYEYYRDRLLSFGEAAA